MKNKSSIESLLGIIEIGKPAITENSMPILDDCIIFTLSYDVACKMFSLHNWLCSFTNEAYPNIPTKQKQLIIKTLEAHIIFENYFGVLGITSSYIQGILI